MTLNVSKTDVDRTIFVLEHFPDLIYEHRTELGESLAVAAAQIGIHAPALSLLERGVREPKLYTIVDILAYIGRNR